MTVKKVVILVLAAVLIFSTAGCKTPGSNTAKSDQPQILCAAFAEFDWVRNIIGNNPANIKLTLLNQSGMDMHSYQPSVADMAAIADSDLVVFTGGESEFWIKDALTASGSETGEHISIMEVFQHNHELSEGYVLDCEDEHHDNHQHNNHEDHEHTADEHLWLSLKMAPVFIEEIAGAVAALDPENAEHYHSNASDYISQINSLDKQFEELTDKVSGTQQSTILIADRDPFKYFFEDYGLTHIAAFPGCSAETEASFETILTLSETIDCLNLPAVGILKKSKSDLAHTVIKNSSNPEAEILVFDSMQSITSKDIENGAAWLCIMEENLASLRKAIN